MIQSELTLCKESEQRQQDPIRAKRDTDDSMTSKTTVAANYYDPMLDPVARKKASPKKSMKLSQAMLYIIPDSTRDYRDTWVTVLVADLLLPDCNQDPTTLSQSLRFQIFRNKFSRLGNVNGSVWFQDRDSAAKEVTNVVVLGEALWRMQQMRDMGMQMRLG